MKWITTKQIKFLLKNDKNYPQNKQKIQVKT